VKGRVERKEGIPRIVALEMEELHMEPGPAPIYLDASVFVGLSHEEASRAFGLLGHHPGESPVFLFSIGDGLEEWICAVEDSSDFHAELKQVLGPKCISYTSPVAAEPSVADPLAEPEMERVS